MTETEELAPVQIGHLEDEARDMVDLIHVYTLSADFARWITDGEFVSTTIKESIGDVTYSRIIQYTWRDLVFFTGIGEFDVAEMKTTEALSIIRSPSPIYSTDSIAAKVQKKHLYKLIADPQYTVISQFHAQNKVSGTSWEIWNLPCLVKIYKEKEDPLGYWKKSRRE